MVNMILDMDLEDPAIDETIRDWVKVGSYLDIPRISCYYRRLKNITSASTYPYIVRKSYTQTKDLPSCVF